MWQKHRREHVRHSIIGRLDRKWSGPSAKPASNIVGDIVMQERFAHAASTTVSASRGKR